MNTQISVPISTGMFVDLVDFLREQGSNRDPVEVISTAIGYWMQNASWKQEDLMPETIQTESHGFTWKYKDDCIFLPHGSEIRMSYKGQYHYAKVEGDNILYNGGIVSPAGLANRITKSSRNAWKDLWIKRPGEKDWTLADHLRPLAELSQPNANELLNELSGL
jgi:hypothetical protein